MSIITGALDLSAIPEDLFDPGVPLRAAVVFDGVVLGATVIKQTSRTAPTPFSVEFAAPYAGPNAILPCQVRLLIGPDVSDLDLLGLDTVALEVDLTRRADLEATDGGEGAAQAMAGGERQARDDFRINVGVLQATEALYYCWIFCCRTYTIRGRVVCRHWRYDPATRSYRFCDEPVPGAVVEAYDVDRLFIWFRRDLIKSATTDLNGNFVIQFRWCCFRWGPWLLKNWALDPDVFARVQELLRVAGITLPLPGPGPDPDPVYLQGLLADASLAPKTRLLAAPGIVDGPLSAESLLSILPASPELAAQRIWPWFDHTDCAPDVVFRVTQQCGDQRQVRVIHTETNAQVRWDIPTNLSVTLLANDQACCIPVCREPACPGCLKLTWVGCTPTDQIGTSAAPLDLRGYARTATLDDRPFFGNLQIRGVIGNDIDYFKVQISRNGGAYTDLPAPALGGFNRSYWGPGVVSASFAPEIKSGQQVMITRRHYEALHALPLFGGSVVWFDYDTLFYFNTETGLTPDDVYQLRLVGYTVDGADNLVLSSARILPTCGVRHEEAVYVRVDNQAMIHPVSSALHPCGPGTIHLCTSEPDCYIRRVCVNEGLPGEYCVAACDIVRLSASDTVTIHFSASVPPTTQDGHLGGYTLRAEYGIAAYFPIGVAGGAGLFEPDPTFVVGPEYHDALSQGAPRPHWYGGDYKVRLRGSDFPVCCAYLLRLRAWKRTTNGCTDPRWVHYNEFEIAFTVLRKELCPDVCAN